MDHSRLFIITALNKRLVTFINSSRDSILKASSGKIATT